MYEWNEMIQKAIDWIEEHIEDNPSLAQLAEKIGYSPWYLSVKFHEIVGMTLRSYIAGWRLARAADEVRDTDGRLLDIALKYGYLKDNGRVVSSVEQMAWSFNIDNYKGGKYKWNDACPCYQRHHPEGLGYQVLRPIIEK